MKIKILFKNICYVDFHKMEQNKVIIIGGGCAGLTAAIYCGRAELEPILFADNLEDKGGLLVKTSQVENFPSYPDGIDGYDLVTNMEKQAVKYGTRVINSRVIYIDFSKKPFHIIDSDSNEYRTETIIICTGSKPNKLGLENENKFWTNGISSCAVCDGALYKNKKIIVVGGSDTAVEHALFLTKFSNVTLIHRRDTLRASKIMQKRLLAHPKIYIIYDTVIKELRGNKKLESITIVNVKTGETKDLAVDGLFYGLGLRPNTELFKGVLNMDNEEYITKMPYNNYETMTSIPGVFVAGDVSDKIYRQAIVAAGDGCRAAMDVNNYLNEHY